MTGAGEEKRVGLGRACSAASGRKHICAVPLAVVLSYFMDDLADIIRRHGLQETLEYIIVPFRAGDGSLKRAFFLKRSHIRIVFPDQRHEDYPLEDVLEATVRFPEQRLTEALAALYLELGKDLRPSLKKTIVVEEESAPDKPDQPADAGR